MASQAINYLWELLPESISVVLRKNRSAAERYTWGKGTSSLYNLMYAFKIGLDPFLYVYSTCWNTAGYALLYDLVYFSSQDQAFSLYQGPGTIQELFLKIRIVNFQRGHSFYYKNNIMGLTVNWGLPKAPNLCELFKHH